MSKHHQSKAEQINNKTQNVEPFYNEKKPSQADQSIKTDDRSIQLRAYQIHQEKGGTAIDNWQEAERTLRNQT